MGTDALGAAAQAHYMEKVAVDERRGRELFSYLSPENLIPPPLQRTLSGSQGVESLNDGLTPFVQLAALRCNAQKAMLNFMDKGQMFFVAEASREQDDQEKIVEDVIFLGCSSVPLAGRVCELTVALKANPNDPQAPLFVVPNLFEDERFSSLPFVTGPPYYRFYAGTPIRTPAGVNIGSLAVMDIKPRVGLTSLETRTLCETAAHVMSYLNVHRRAKEGARALRIGEGFDCFVAGKRTIEKQITLQSDMDSNRSRKRYGVSLESDEDDIKLHKMKTHLSSQRRSRPIHPAMRQEKSGSHSSNDEAFSQHSSVANPTSNSDEDSDLHSPVLFARAANLIRESFELGPEGGVQFFGIRNDSELKTTLRALRRQSTLNLETAQPCSTSSNTTEAASVIAYSTQQLPFCSDTTFVESDLDEGILANLVTSYPSGKIWSADRNPKGSSSEDDTQRFIRTSNKERKMAETQSILKIFPGKPHSVMFVPLWDTTSAAFTHAAFVFTREETRNFSATTDLTFLRYFSGQIMAESSRLSAVIADRQKSNFVQTISHEMRSPLHGLLGSAEFLESTNLEPFQKYLVDTVNSCGRTLLDTINHVLDFSKISSFMASNESMNRGKKRLNHRNSDSLSRSFAGAPPLLQLTAQTDVSLILEEVMDGIALGQNYSSGGLDLTDSSHLAREKNSNDLGTNAIESVEVIVDIQKADWIFMTQPGALRRIVMNLVGNATKATSSGSITVKLRLKSIPNKAGSTEFMTLTVTDTGRGISPEFLKSKMFVPFAQENPLTPGTGLGLSIVRSILTMLGGDIEIDSEIGKGTVVKVSLPLARVLPGERSSTGTLSSNGATQLSNSASEDSVDALRLQAPDCQVALVGFSSPHQISNQNHSLFESLSHYVTDWFGFEKIDEKFANSSSIILVDEKNLEALTSDMKNGHQPALIVLCSVASRHNRALIDNLQTRVGGEVDFIVKPCGPHKLAQCIRGLLDKQQAIREKSSRLDLTDKLLTPLATPILQPGLADSFQELTLKTPNASIHMTPMQGDERIAVSQTSLHAHMAISDPYASPGIERKEDGKGYPFPSIPHNGSDQLNSQAEITTLANGSKKSSAAVINSISTETTGVHVLLVDDNAINLRLLQTYMKTKRKCGRIALAENGQLAVDTVMSAARPFDVIFMDISMPIKDGFEATRDVREWEASTNAPASAMIIALTGLASGDDQAEAFNCGVDVYMTKPVKFSEVGKLLDNWEAHQKMKGVNGDVKPANGTAAEVGVDAS